MVNEMYIYIGMLTYFVFIGYALFVNREDSFGKRKIFLVLSAVSMMIIMGCRDVHVGTDTISYGNYFRQVSEISWLDCVLSRGTALKNAPFYLLWSKVVLIFSGGNYQFFLILNAIIICGAVFYFIYENSNHVVMSTFLYVLGYYYLNSLNASRQYMSFSFMLVAYTFMRKNKKKKAFLFTALGIGIHVVSICFLPVIILASNRIERRILKKVYGYCIICSCITGSLWSLQFIFGINYFTDLWSRIARNFVKIFPKYKAYLWNSGVSIYATGEGKKIYLEIFYLLFVLTAICIIYFSKNVSEKKKDYLLDMLIPSSVGVVMGIIGAKLLLISRIELYFSVFTICLIPEVLFLFEKKYRYLTVIVTLGIMFIPFYMQLDSNISEVVPYVWFWEAE
ncbi:MAG: EpsG family protein [Lachnospiraceae bacterium]|nr:EpsG family protein [Lachnospiraceae bacterium]